MRYSPAPIVLMCAAAVSVPGFMITQAIAGEYMTADAFKLQTFPEATALTPVPLLLSADQRTQLASRLAGIPLTLSRLKLSAVYKGETLLGYIGSDAVLGKEQLIDFAVAFAPDLTLRHLEILAYRETHGFEIRNAAWRNQFTGKGRQSALHIGSDIQNISGATLSCTHVTDAVRKMTAVLDTLAAGKR
ncbi:FMN-binding protein [Burkholderiaceae bacterium DAT-1]|nr:FMN-binding protein [Burkholderiaceae bacterium DAT-1]